MTQACSAALMTGGFFAANAAEPAASDSAVRRVMIGKILSSIERQNPGYHGACLTQSSALTTTALTGAGRLRSHGNAPPSREDRLEPGPEGCPTPPPRIE